VLVRKIEILCLPKDVPEEIEVDVSNLEIGDVIHFSQIKSEDMQTKLSGDTTIVAVRAPRKIEEAEKAAKEIISTGVKDVVVTLGKEGALVVNSKETTHVPNFEEVKIVDSTGAGDAFNGGLAIALSEGKNLVEATYFANAVASLNVTKIGTAPAMPYREEVEEFFKKSFTIK